MKFKSFSSLNSENAKKFVYRFFKKFPNWNHLDTGKIKDYSKIIKEFHKDFIDIVCEERYGAELPNKLGCLYITSYKSNKDYPNFALYNEKGIKKTFSNNSTDGFKCRLIYSNYEPRFRLKDKFLWEFIGETKFRKKISASFINNHTKYIASPLRSRDNFDWQLKIKEKELYKINQFLVNYDEFNLN